MNSVASYLQQERGCKSVALRIATLKMFARRENTTFDFYR
jgi:hypothetical protein